MPIEPFFDERTSTLTYVVYDEPAAVGVVIDPVLDFDPASGRTWTESADAVAAFIESKGLEVPVVLDTHAHADHLSAMPFQPDYGTARCDFPGGSAEQLHGSIRRLYEELPPETRVFTCHDYQPGGRELAFEATLAEHRASNVQLDDTTSVDDFVSFRERRDATLAMPTLILPSIQVNVRAGDFPEPEDNGVSYLKLPLNVFGRPHSAGEGSS